jgi:hypothetical protein
MEINTVDDFIKARVLPQYYDIVSVIRKLMREYAPNAKEAMGYGMPVYKGNRVFAYILPTRKDITFGFTRGSKFKDKYGLLKGVGKTSKHIKIRDLNDINKDALRYYIKQALEFDTK